MLLLTVELGHGTFIRLVSGIVALAARLVIREVAADFLQSLRILHLLVAHGRLCLRVHSVEVKDFFIGCG